MSNTHKDKDTEGRHYLVLGLREMSFKHDFSSSEAKHQLCPSYQITTVIAEPSNKFFSEEFAPIFPCTRRKLHKVKEGEVR